MKYLPYILVFLYVLSPIDLLPERALGRLGMVDDIVLIFAAYIYHVYHTALRKARQRIPGDGGEAPAAHAQAAAARDPYEVLGLPGNASPEQIKHAYRELANKYHPDKVSHLGEEFKQIANQRFKEIDTAYQALLPK